jgi:putative drug exporter of the RND superfamily
VSRFLARLGSMSARRPWRVIATMALILLALGASAGAVGAGFTDEVRLGDTDSQQAGDLLSERFAAAAGDTATIVVHVDEPTGLTTGPTADAVQGALGSIADQPDVVVVTPLQVSAEGTIGYADVLFAARAADLDVTHLTRLEEAVDPLEEAGVEASMRGPVVDRWRERPVPVGELVGLLAALVLVTLLFRSVVATLVTVGSALIGLVLGNTVLAVVSGFVDIPTVAPTIAIMLGLGAGIDYALFLVARFRDRLRAGEDVVTAAATATGTTGTAVITAAAVVVVSICGLYVTGITIIGRLGLAAALVVTVVAVTTVLLVPSLLRLAGRRVLPRSERAAPAAEEVTATSDHPTGNTEASEGRRARRVAQAMARRPWVVASVATVTLLALAAPALGLTLGQPDDGNRPVGDTMRTAYDRLTEGFGPGFNGPLVVAVDLSETEDPVAVTERLGGTLASTDGIQSVLGAQTSPAGDTAVLTVIPTSAPQSAQTSALVERLRADVLPDVLQGTGATAHVGGQTATFDDLATKVSGSLLLLIVVVVGTSVILLMLAFRSVVLPLVSAAMNLLSIGAAYGVVTLAFQTQLGTSLLGIQEQPVVSFVPMLMFAILFGLSMDYNVFLLSAVQDERMAGFSARAAVPRAVGRTSALITTAGAIMAMVFLGFSVTDEAEVRMIGIGLATAVIIDVTIVRLFLAPAVLELLGERAWWMPSWLARRVPGRVALAH